MDSGLLLEYSLARRLELETVGEGQRVPEAGTGASFLMQYAGFVIVASKGLTGFLSGLYSTVSFVYSSRRTGAPVGISVQEIIIIIIIIIIISLQTYLIFLLSSLFGVILLGFNYTQYSLLLIKKFEIALNLVIKRN